MAARACAGGAARWGRRRADPVIVPAGMVACGWLRVCLALWACMCAGGSKLVAITRAPRHCEVVRLVHTGRVRLSTLAPFSPFPPAHRVSPGPPARRCCRRTEPATSCGRGCAPANCGGSARARMGMCDRAVVFGCGARVSGAWVRWQGGGTLCRGAIPRPRGRSNAQARLLKHSHSATVAVRPGAKFVSPSVTVMYRGNNPVPLRW